MSADHDGGDTSVAEFARRMAHDLRNPLTSVSMSLQMLREEQAVADSEELSWLVERALSGARRLDAVIEQLVRSAVGEPAGEDRGAGDGRR